MHQTCHNSAMASPAWTSNPNISKPKYRRKMLTFFLVLPPASCPGVNDATFKMQAVSRQKLPISLVRANAQMGERKEMSCFCQGCSGAACNGICLASTLSQASTP